METIATMMFFAVGAGVFTDLIAFAMGDPNQGYVEEGRILSRFGAWALRRFEKRFTEIGQERTNRLQKHLKAGRSIDTEPPYQPVNWWKLFVCPRCMGTWISVASFIAFAVTFDLSGAWAFALIPFVGVSSVSLSIATLARNPK